MTKELWDDFYKGKVIVAICGIKDGWEFFRDDPQNKAEATEDEFVDAWHKQFPSDDTIVYYWFDSEINNMFYQENIVGYRCDKIILYNPNKQLDTEYLESNGFVHLGGTRYADRKKGLVAYFKFKSCGHCYNCRNGNLDECENMRRVYTICRGPVIMNLTPHDVNLIHRGGVVEVFHSRGIARCSTNLESNDNDKLQFVPLHAMKYGEVIGLPEKYDNVFYIVSQLVMLMCPDRDDLLVPSEIVYNNDNHVVGCESFSNKIILPSKKDNKLSMEKVKSF